jgi:hypothetical protein
MKQSRRILLFLFSALLIGIPSVYFLFYSSGAAGDNCWLPNCRVLLRIEKTFQGTDFAYCMMECYDFGEKEYNGMLADGNVEFDESHTKGERKEYLIVTENAQGEELRIRFKAQGELAHLVEINGDTGNNKCTCEAD